MRFVMPSLPTAFVLGQPFFLSHFSVGSPRIFSRFPSSDSRDPKLLRNLWDADLIASKQ
jgi:hypothetical protein